MMRQILVKLVVETTQKWQETVFGSDPRAPEDILPEMLAVLDKVTNIDNRRIRETLVVMIDKVFGAPTGTAHRYLNRTADGDLDLLPLWPYVAIVPVNHTGADHNYPMGRPAVTLSTQPTQLVREDGTVGNDLPPQRRYLRPAGPAEIEELFNQLDDEAITKNFHSALMLMRFGRKELVTEEVAEPVVPEAAPVEAAEGG
jgi:hypothetical protein